MNHLPDYLDHIVEYLHGTNEREASEEPHGSSYSGQLVYKLGSSVLVGSKFCPEVFSLSVTFLMLSKVDVEKEILTNFSLFLNSRTENRNVNYNSSSSYSLPFMTKG